MPDYVQQSNARARRAKENMKIIKKEITPTFTEKDLTDMYAEKVLCEILKDSKDAIEKGFIVYWGKTWEDGARGTITSTIWKEEEFESAIEEYQENKECCEDVDNHASTNCYYEAFIGKIIAKGVVCLIDAYAVKC